MPDRRLFLEAATVHELVGRLVEARLGEVGIPPYLLALLTHVREHAPVSPSGVAEASGVPLTTLRDNVQRLVDRGLVRRAPNPDDGRSYLLVATAKGRAVADAAGAALLGAYVAVEERLPKRREHYERALEELNEALRGALALETGGASRPEASSGPQPPARAAARASARVSRPA